MSMIDSDELQVVFHRAIHEHIDVAYALNELGPSVATVSRRMIGCLEAGGKICWMGNGGSAADSQHLAAELVGRFRRERKALASLALTTDTSILTALGNDYSYEIVFARQVEALCSSKDIVVGISTSGKSANVLRALEAGRRIGAFTVGISGRHGTGMSGVSDILLMMPGDDTARIQEAYMLVGHIICDHIEAHFASEHSTIHRAIA